MYNKEDFHEHKEQVDSLRIFAKELGLLPGSKAQGVGIPSFAVSTKGNLPFNLPLPGIAKKITGTKEMKEVRLPEELDNKKIMQKAEDFMLGLVREEDFEEYLDGIDGIISREMKKRDFIVNEDHKEKILKLQEAAKEFRRYMNSNLEDHFFKGMELLKLKPAEDLLREEEELKQKHKTQRLDEEIDEFILKPEEEAPRKEEIPLRPKAPLKPNIVKPVEYTEDLLVKSKTNKLDEEELATEIKTKTYASFPPTMTNTQKYMTSSPIPKWHTHYTNNMQNKPKGMDLALSGGLFDNITPSQLDLMATKFNMEKFNRGAVIFKERESGKFHIIKAGKVVLTKSDVQGKDKEILMLAGGEIVGELSVMDGQKYDVNAKVYSEGTVILSIENEDFKEFLTQFPALLQNFNCLCSLRLRDLYNKLTY